MQSTAERHFRRAAEQAEQRGVSQARLSARALTYYLSDTRPRNGSPYRPARSGSVIPGDVIARYGFTATAYLDLAESYREAARNLSRR